MIAAINEEWKDVEGYEGHYQISSLGRVRNLSKLKRYHNTIFIGKVGGWGYRTVELYKGKTKSSFLIHRLVAKAFIPNPYNLPYVNHKDENKLNNCADNLEWCTPKYNVNYGGARRRMSENSGRNRAVVMYDMNGEKLDRFYNINEAKIAIGAKNHTTISQCCQLKRLSYKQRIWLYEGDEDKLEDIVKKNAESKNFIQVEAWNGKGEYLGKFVSGNQASKELHVPRAVISKCVNENVYNAKYDLLCKKV